MMAAMTETYPSEDAARRAVEGLRAVGVPPRNIRLLTGHPLRDIRREPRGGFAEPVGRILWSGPYAGRVRRRRERTGSLAMGSFTSAPDRQRKGSFANVKRVVIVDFEDRAEHSRLTGYRGVGPLLRRSALDDDTVDHAVKGPPYRPQGRALRRRGGRPERSPGRTSSK
jgi:hypothetical protein